MSTIKRQPAALCLTIIVCILLCSAGCRGDQASMVWGTECEKKVNGREIHAILSVLGNSSSEPLAAVLIVQGKAIAPLRESISITSTAGSSIISVNGVPQKQAPEFMLYMNAADGSLRRIGVDPNARAIFQQNRDCMLEELLEFWELRK